jgi:predicted DCC family thiol-disulfide oxidoreductase YuxK
MQDHPVILFDGVCNFCNAAINLVLKKDVTKAIRFAPLQSAAGQTLQERYGLHPADMNSFVFIEDGKAFTRSSAALKVLAYLPWYFRMLKVFAVLPESWRDSLYDFVAKRRYQWFGRRESCMIPTAEMRKRFLE